MTTAADDSAVGDAFEALLAGRPAPEGQAGLAAFTRAVRSSSSEPGRPNAALAQLLATGHVTDQSSPSVRTARSAGSPPPARSSRVRTRRRTAMIFPVLLAKFLSAGAVAQAATGAGVVVIAFTGVGAAGALPAPAQRTFSTVVTAVTPLEAPGSEEQTEDVAVGQTVEGDAEMTEEATGVAGEGPAAVDARVEDWILHGPDPDEPFGAWVSEGSKDDVKDWLRANDMTFGDVVSAWANGDGLSDEQLAVLGIERDAEDDEPKTQVPALVEDAPAAVVTDTGSGGISGEAKGQGQTQTKAQTKSQTKSQTKAQTKAQTKPQTQGGQARSQGAAQGNGRGDG